MPYAEVSVNSPIAQRRAFSYRVPEGLKLEIGQAVWVPFGEKVLQGIVLELTAKPSVPETRDIAGILSPLPLLTPEQVELARWISSYYLTPLFEAVALMLPPGFERRVMTLIGVTGNGEGSFAGLNAEQREVAEYIRARGTLPLSELEKAFGKNKIRMIVPRLISQKVLVKSYQLEKVKIKPRIVTYASLSGRPEEVRRYLENSLKKAPRQADLLQYLIENPRPVGLAELRRRTKATPAAVKALAARGLIELREVQVDRDPLPVSVLKLPLPLALTPRQEEVLKEISFILRREKRIPSRGDIFLLRGVTGSGKTEIYLRALEEAVKLGKMGIVLVPEIAMTPQIIERFVSRFPGEVAVMHSELSLGEQFDEWWRIKRGEFKVVIGPRSAIFAPQPEPGLIIIDEEHEWTYKQQDVSPRYHTRKVALKLAELTGATVVLGSATPDVESYYKALSHEYRLLELPERVTPDEGSPLPEVEVVDLRQELKAGNYSLFSRALKEAMETALKNGEQVLLFLNRRGAASFVECRECGHVIRCRRCAVSLTYHFAGDILVCHQCNYQVKSPDVCPRCRSRKIKYLGAGTEKLEEETAKYFPGARLLRWDSDVTRGHSGAHQEIFRKFRNREADVLIGTQIIAKGLDLPGVTVVGVVSADTALNLPDFRAGERTFQILSQVAGRAGRGAGKGRVIIQTYSPENYSIQAAARHDYGGFYRKEIEYRREFRNPPFSALARMVFSHISEQRCQEETARIQRLLIQERDSRGLADIDLIGPAPSFLQRIRGHFRWQIILRGNRLSEFLAGIPLPAGWTVDIDPVGLL